jgi:radical SAM protein with 4Fe4S-binding SPASM domain
MTSNPIDCFYAKNHALVWSNGSIAPCCNYKDGEDPIGNYTNVFEFFNSPEMLQLRDDHANGIKRQGCRKCWSVEDIGGTSYRKPSNPDHTGQLKGLDIALGRTCTLKCRTCGAFASSAWESELKYRGIHKDWGKLTSDETPLEAYDHIEQLDIQGGEPFLDKRLPTILNYLYTKGISKNVNLTIITNLEWFPDERFTEPLKRFKNLLIKISIDGVDARNEYMRSGSTWSNTVDVAKKWGQFKHTNPDSNIKIVISHTISTFNFLYYDEMVAETGRLRTFTGLEDLELWAHYALENEWHNCFLLPVSIKEEAVDLWKQGTPQPWEYQNFRDNTVNMLLQERPVPPLPFDKWWYNNAEMDNIRGQLIQDALPEVVSMFERHGLFYKDHWTR